jgi:hypothetical protein
MIFQFLLSAALCFIVIYAFTQNSKSPFVSNLIIFCALFGMYFVWLPNHANAIAHFFRIGRGADLIFYCWVIISLLLLLNLHFKARSNLELISTLARKIAIIEAEKNYKHLSS